MTVRSTLILASGMAKPNGPVHNVSDLACRSRHHSDPLAGLLTPFRCRVLLSLPGAPSVFSVVNRQYNTEKPELQGDPRPFQFSPVHSPLSWPSILRYLGLSLGVLFGLTDNIGLGMMIGVDVGLCGGSAVGAPKGKEEETSDEEKENGEK